MCIPGSFHPKRLDAFAPTPHTEGAEGEDGAGSAGSAGSGDKNLSPALLTDLAMCRELLARQHALQFQVTDDSILFAFHASGSPVEPCGGASVELTDGGLSLFPALVAGSFALDPQTVGFVKAVLQCADTTGWLGSVCRWDLALAPAPPPPLLALLRGDALVLSPLPLASSMRAFGSVRFVFPLIAQAQSARDVMTAVQLLQGLLRLPSNRTTMLELNGWPLLAWLLRGKAQLVSVEVVEQLVQLSVTAGGATGPCVLLSHAVT